MAAIAYDGRRACGPQPTARARRNEIRDPFKQAERGIWSIVDEIKRRKLLDGGDVPCARSHGIVFPDRRYEPRDVPARRGPELVIDQTRLPLTEEQSICLDLLELNPRSVVD